MSNIIYPDAVNLIVDSHHGMYVPQLFATHVDLTQWNMGEDDERLTILREGPEHEHYWDVWVEVLDDAHHVDPYGGNWHLEHDGDLFAVCPDRMSEAQHLEFYGEEREA